jgi:hypothetical protein
MNNNMRKLILALLVLFPGIFLFGQKQVILLADSNQILPNNYSFYYMLPKTALQVNVTVIKTKEIKGYYAEYAEKYLGLSNVITNNKTSYKLKNVSLTAQEIPDSQYIYAVELTSAQIRNEYYAHIYDSKSNNAQSIRQISDYSVSSVAIPDFFKYYSNLAYTEADDSFVETKIINGVVTQVPVNQTKIVSNTKDQQAQQAADYIAKIRKDRYDLIIGTQEVPYTKEALELMIQELNRTEQNYLDLFTGFTIEEEVHYSVETIPDGNSNKIPLFAINQDDGFSECHSTESADNYYLLLEPQITNDLWTSLMTKKSGVEKYKPNTGYCIRKSVPVNISLWNNNMLRHKFGTVPIYQFGKLEILPSKLEKFDITLYGIIY